MATSETPGDSPTDGGATAEAAGGVTADAAGGALSAPSTSASPAAEPATGSAAEPATGSAAESAAESAPARLAHRARELGARMWRTRPPAFPHNAPVLGVCEGLGVRYRVDPSLFRVLFAVALLTWPKMLCLYLVLAGLMPRFGMPFSAFEAVFRRGVADLPYGSSRRDAGWVLLAAAAFCSGLLGWQDLGEGLLAFSATFAAGAAGLVLLHLRAPVPPQGLLAAPALRGAAASAPRADAASPAVGDAASGRADDRLGAGQTAPWYLDPSGRPDDAAAVPHATGSRAGRDSDATDGARGTDYPSHGGPADGPADETAGPVVDLSEYVAQSGWPDPRSRITAGTRPTWDPLGAAPFDWSHSADRPVGGAGAATAAGTTVAHAASGQVDVPGSGPAGQRGTADAGESATDPDAADPEAIRAVRRRRRRGRGGKRWTPAGVATLAVAGVAVAGVIALGALVPGRGLDLTFTSTPAGGWAPRGEDELEEVYTAGVGASTLDLTGVGELREDHEVQVDGGVGALEVRLPENTRLEVRCGGVVGYSECAEGRFNDDAPGGLLHVRVEHGLGAVTVTGPGQDGTAGATVGVGADGQQAQAEDSGAAADEAHPGPRD